MRSAAAQGGKASQTSKPSIPGTTRYFIMQQRRNTPPPDGLEQKGSQSFSRIITLNSKQQFGFTQYFCAWVGVILIGPFPVSTLLVLELGFDRAAPKLRSKKFRRQLLPRLPGNFFNASFTILVRTR